MRACDQKKGRNSSLDLSNLNPPIWKLDNRITTGINILCTVKLDFKELLIKEQIGFKELFYDYQLFYTINLLLNKELLPI